MRNFASSTLRLFLMAIFHPGGDQIIVSQRRARGVRPIKENIASGAAKCLSTDSKGTIFFENRLVVPKNRNLWQLILKEAHDTPLSIHPGSTKNVPRST